MNICQIVPSLEEQYGGPSKSVRSVSAALARAGHDVTLCATHLTASAAGDEHLEGKLRVQIFRRDWPGRLCPSAGLRHALWNGSAEVIHHHSLWLRTLHYAHRRARRDSTPLVVSPRGMMSQWAWRHRNWRKRISRWIIHPGALEAVAGWHATSVEEEQDIRALGFKQPVCVAPNGVDAPDEDARAEATRHWLQACPVAAQRRVALFYSRFHQKKRVLELIDLWLERGPRDWLLLLVGIPQDYDPDMLERYVAKMSGAGRVVAFSGTGRPPPYAIASLFVLPSHNENFGLVIAEAMAHGVPALVTDTTPWSALNDHDLGWCVPWSEYGDVLRVATSESANRLAQRGAAAREWILREFSWDASAQQLANFYLTLRRSDAVGSR